MTAPDHPMPSSGGTWLRDPATGALTPIDDDAAADAALAGAAAPQTSDRSDAPSAKARKPLKEG